MAPVSEKSARATKLTFALVILAYFVYFNWEGLWAHFTADDMMNMDQYWRMGPARLLLEQFMPWRGSYRPMAGLFYMPLLQVFGLNPLPYHAALLAVLLVNLYLMYRFARLAGADELQAAIATLITAYHAGLSMLYYSTAFLYDVLCFAFYMAALICYARVRSQGRALRGREIALVIGLYLCALNSKEMALTLPLVLLAYEYFCAPRKGLRIAALQLPILLAALLSAVYFFGKIFGPDPLLGAQGYRPVFTWHQFFAAHKIYFGELFLSGGRFTWHGVVAVWLLLLYLAWRRDRPVLRFCFVFLMLTPLPIVFLEGRSGACLYIPLAGWAVFAAVVLTDLADAAANFLSSEPGFRRIGRTGLLAALLVSALFLWAKENDYRRRAYGRASMADVGRLTWQTIEQLRALNPHLPPHSEAAFLHDPFEGWDMAFIADLWFRDHTLHFYLQRLAPVSEPDLRKMHLFDFQDGKLVQLR
ncbi:MAG: hypothetical protein JWP63_3694 [Candidatus Solibacter sp.]|nr:hypothetical protein [Candidatus Solibacter sp.]